MKYRLIVSLITSLWLICGSRLAMAQQQEDLDAGNVLYLISCAISLPVLSTSSIMNFSSDSKKEDLREEIKHYRNIVRLERYLRDEQREVWMSLALGAGRGMETLVGLYGHRPTKAQRRLLRSQRKRLKTLAAAPHSMKRSRELYYTLLPVFSPSEDTP